MRMRVCARVCVYARACACMRARVRVCVYACACMRARVRVGVRVCVYNACAYARMRARVRVCVIVLRPALLRTKQLTLVTLHFCHRIIPPRCAVKREKRMRRGSQDELPSDR